MLKELFKNDANTRVYESYKSDCKNPFPPLFFYHLNRTGGMAVYYSLHCASLSLRTLKKAGDQSFQDIRFSDYSGSDYFVGRLDSPIENMPFFIMPSLQNSPVFFIATHQPYGFHKYLDRNYHFMTILRDPFDRILSIYLRKCMHEKRKPSHEEFKTLYTQSDGSRNGMVRTLAGNENKFNSDTERVKFVIDNLRKVFHTFTISKNIDTLISRYLSIYQLPNVIMNMPNQSPHEQRGLFERFRDDIYALNQEDL